MLYNAPTGSTNPDAPYVGKNVAAGQQGSRLNPKAVEAPQRELVGIINEAGITPSNDDFKQALKALRSGKLWGYTDTSSVANQLVIGAITAHLALNKHLGFRVFPANANTGACTLAVNQIAPVPLTRRDGSALQANDIAAGVPFDCVFDGQQFRLTGLAQGEVSRIVALPVLWVRTDGNDANKGLGNNAAQAFATIGAALAYGIQYLAYTGTLLTIALGNAGEYAAPGTQSIAGAAATLLGGAGTIQIVGDVLNQDSYRIVGAGFAGNNGILHNSFGTNLTIKGVKIENNSASFDTVRSATNGTTYLECVTFGGINGTAGAHITASDGGTVKIGPGCKVVSSRGCMLYGNAGGITLQGTATLTLVGALTFNTFCQVDANGRVLANGSISGGVVTGKRYDVRNGGFIGVNGAGVNYFPGTIAGTAFSADQYA